MWSLELCTDHRAMVSPLGQTGSRLRRGGILPTLSSFVQQCLAPSTSVNITFQRSLLGSMPRKVGRMLQESSSLAPPPASHGSPASHLISLAPETESSNSYDDAITALNSLQTNAALLAKVRKERQRNVHLNLPVTTRYLERSGMTLEDLDSIKVIHVSGTKGKGSTCAFCESILRHQGLKTGFYSSPHLISATERIRINGVPIEESKFTMYFWQVYNSVCRGFAEDDRPPYFKFLTILAFYIFWKERVEVAVIEVGIGGAFDCTNIIRKPVVCGITALGHDHTSLLGSTIAEIAWHKAGILKQGVTAYIEPQQPPDALRVVAERAEELGATVATAGSLEEQGWGDAPQVLGLEGDVQRSNASLGLALASHFLAVTRGLPMPPLLPTPLLPVLAPLPVTNLIARGLMETRWPGRSQVISRPGIHWCLDGAHTEESLAACAAWYRALATPEKTFRVLLFNTTGERDVKELLEQMAQLPLDQVVFCTNLSLGTDKKDQQNFTTTNTAQLERCHQHLEVWEAMEQSSLPPAICIPCINDALLWVAGGRDPTLNGTFFGPEMPKSLGEAELIQVLVTGSLHLVGGVLACLKPRGLDQP